MQDKHVLSRRRFLKSATAGLGLFMLGGCGAGIQRTGRTSPKPNVLFIYTDDQGIGDLGCYGGDDIITPHTDALAERGVRFRQMYAPSSICSPSRAGLLTGCYPHRVGVPNNISSQPGARGMPSEHTTMGDAFRAAGYATAHIGKWHLGYSDDTMPNAQGFDHSFGHMGGCIDNYSHYFYWEGPNRHDLRRNGKEVFYDGHYFPDLMVHEAATFMTDHRDRPFFIYFAVNTPHYPYQPEEKWLTRYRDAGVPYPRDLYGAFVSSQDECIGRLMAHLDALGLRDNTIVVFQSDHGPSTEDRAHQGGGSAGIYRGAKFSLFEGGIRVPAIISWPGTLPNNTIREQMAHAVDWLPTLSALCGIELLDNAIDGKDITAILNSPDASSPHNVLYWRVGAQRAVREGDWKLILNPHIHGQPLSEADNPFLANLAKDPAERVNFAGDFPEIVTRLTDFADAHWR